MQPVDILYRSLHFEFDGRVDSGDVGPVVYTQLWVCLVTADGVCHGLQFGLTDAGAFPLRDDGSGVDRPFLLKQGTHDHNKHKIAVKSGVGLTVAAWLHPSCCVVGCDTGSLFLVRFPPGAPSVHFELSDASTWSRLLAFASTAPKDPVTSVALLALPGSGGGSGGSGVVAVHASGRVRLWSLESNSCLCTVDLGPAAGTATSTGVSSAPFPSSTAVVLRGGGGPGRVLVQLAAGTVAVPSTTCVFVVGHSGAGAGAAPSLTIEKQVAGEGSGVVAPLGVAPAVAQELGSLVGGCLLPAGTLCTAWRSTSAGHEGAGLGVLLHHGAIGAWLRVVVGACVSACGCWHVLSGVI